MERCQGTTGNFPVTFLGSPRLRWCSSPTKFSPFIFLLVTKTNKGGATWRRCYVMRSCGFGLKKELPYFFLFACNSANIFWLLSNFGSIANAFL